MEQVSLIGRFGFMLVVGAIIKILTSANLAAPSFGTPGSIAATAILTIFLAGYVAYVGTDGFARSFSPTLTFVRMRKWIIGSAAFAGVLGLLIATR